VFDEHFGHQGEDDSPPYNIEDLSDDGAVNLYGEEDDSQAQQPDNNDGGH